MMRVRPPRGVVPPVVQALLAGALVVGLGGSAMMGSAAGLGLFVAGFVVLILFVAPWVGVVLILCAILGEGVMDLGIRIRGIPLTEAKLAVALVTVSWGLHAMAGGAQLVGVARGCAGFVAVLVSMLRSVALGDAGRVAIRALLSVTLLVGMLHVLYTLLGYASMDRVYRWVAAVIGVVLLVSVVQGQTAERAEAAMGDPNAWAAVAILISHLALGIVLMRRRRMSTGVLSVGLVLLYLLAVYQTHSRGGLVAASLVLPLTLYGMRWDRRSALVGLVGVVAVSPLFMGNLGATWERFDAILNPEWGKGKFAAIDSRVIMLGRAWQGFLDNPIFGLGLGNLEDKAAYLFPRQGGKDTHNSYAQILAEQGLVGAFAHVWLLVLIVRTGLSAFRNAIDAADRRLAYYLCTGLLGYGIMQLTSGKLVVFPIGYLVLVLLLCHERLVREKWAATNAAT